MRKKQILITAFALFSLFFGAGNLILPSYLGWQAGASWFTVSIGFAVTAVIIPIFGILAHAKIQGSMYDFAKGGGHWFAIVYCLIVYAISVSLPAPRTASVTHEMAIAPSTNSSPLITSTVYFVLVFILVLNRSKLIGFIGKFLSPLIGIILILIIGIAVFGSSYPLNTSAMQAPLVFGLLEGYQTFDAIGAIVVGGVLIVSFRFGPALTYTEKKKHLAWAGIIAGLGLLFIYFGLLYTGAYYHQLLPEKAIRTEVLQIISAHSLGKIGNRFLGVLVALACFTTAVGIVTGTADYFKSYFHRFKHSYSITAAIACLLGILMGQFDVHYIIDIALPVLMFIYPISIILIMLNNLPKQLQSVVLFRSVILVTFVFSIPDFLNILSKHSFIESINSYILLSEYHLGWLLPAILCGFFVIGYQHFRLKEKQI